MGLRKHTLHCEIFAKAIAEYIDYYNNRRYQWHLARLSPNELYKFVTTGKTATNQSNKKIEDTLNEASNGNY